MCLRNTRMVPRYLLPGIVHFVPLWPRCTLRDMQFNLFTLSWIHWSDRSTNVCVNPSSHRWGLIHPTHSMSCDNTCVLNKKRKGEKILKQHSFNRNRSCFYLPLTAFEFYIGDFCKGQLISKQNCFWEKLQLNKFFSRSTYL